MDYSSNPCVLVSIAIVSFMVGVCDHSPPYPEQLEPQSAVEFIFLLPPPPCPSPSRALSSKLLAPLQSKVEEWKKTTTHMEREHDKGVCECVCVRACVRACVCACACVCVCPCACAHVCAYTGMCSSTHPV